MSISDSIYTKKIYKDVLVNITGASAGDLIVGIEPDKNKGLVIELISKEEGTILKGDRAIIEEKFYLRRVGSSKIKKDLEPYVDAKTSFKQLTEDGIKVAHMFYSNNYVMIDNLEQDYADKLRAVMEKAAKAAKK